MKTRSAKAKGRRLALKVKEMLDKAFGFSKGDVHATNSGVPGMDLQLSPAARAVFGYATECKNQERLQIWQALDQAKENAEAEGLIPLLIFSRNHDTVYAVVTFDHFLELCQTKGNC